MIINKDTSIYGSFAKQAGNKGCILFNNAFEFYQLNAIYKSFSVDNITAAVEAARTLDIKGFAVTMPYKIDVLQHVDEHSEEVEKIEAVNTVVNRDGRLKAHNTDYLAAKALLAKTFDAETDQATLYILGEGGYSKAVQYAAKTLGLSYNIINRKSWDSIQDIKDSVIYNCTPVEDISLDRSNYFIDCSVNTDTGRLLGKAQAGHQFELYTGKPAPQGIFCR